MYYSMETAIDWRDKDASGKDLDIKQKLMAIRLRRWQTRARAKTSYEDNLARAAQELERLKALTGVPRPCVEQALEIYRQALERELAAGWSPEAMAAAALYMACRTLKTPRPLGEFLKYSKADKSAVRRAAWKLNELVRGRPPLEDYVKAVAARANLPAAYVKRALEILAGNRKAVVAKSPWVLAAAALWLATHRKHGMLIRLAEAAGVTVEGVKNAITAFLTPLAEPAEGDVEEERAVGSMRLTDIRGAEVFVGGGKHVVTVLGGGAEPEEGGSGRTLLRIKITAEVDGVRGHYTITFGRRRPDNAIVGRAHARADAPGGREADAERLVALVEALTGKRPRIRRKRSGAIMITCTRKHLDGFARYAELAEAIRRWLEETK
jgi:transcription initiation factor TFIIIB Brf1 subunit/transcription initiation factor TFIIB